MAKNLGLLFEEEEREEEEQTRIFDKQEERLRIEADVLRAECKFLRMERDLAFQKLEETQGRKKIDRSRRLMVDVNARRRRRRERPAGIGSNFDRNASVVRRQLADETHEEKEIREVASSAGTSVVPRHEEEEDVEMLRRKMEGMSKGMLQRVEECGSLLLLSANGSSNGHYQRQVLGRELGRAGSGSCCCNCKCKQVVARIADQVKAEKEHWTEMQRMLDQVRLEMEDLKSSRNHWQRRAIASELELRTRHHNMMEQKQRANAYEKNLAELHKHACNLKITSRNEGLHALTNSSSLTRTNYLDIFDTIRLPKIKCQQKQQDRRLPDCTSRDKEKEKRVLICHLNNSKRNSERRMPLHDVSNSFPVSTKHSTTNNSRRDFAS